jgi:hypothetical protein
MQKMSRVIVGAGFVLLGVLGVIHHLVISGRLFNLSDILHHEFFEAIFFTAGIVLLLTVLLDRK